LKELLGDAVTLVIETIEKHINCFFVQALQLDPKTLFMGDNGLVHRHGRFDETSDMHGNIAVLQVHSKGLTPCFDDL
jgi:hypothetical protein